MRIKQFRDLIDKMIESGDLLKTDKLYVTKRDQIYVPVKNIKVYKKLNNFDEFNKLVMEI